MAQISVYQIIHTLDGEIFHLEEHLKRLFEAYYQVFSGYIKLDEKQIRTQILDRLNAARAPRTISLFVQISVYQGGQIKIEKPQRSLYKGYTLRCIVPRAALVNFSLPHVYAPTSIRRELTEYSNEEARKRGGEVALRVDAEQVDLINCAQIFMVTERGVATAALSHSVEHALAKRAALQLGLTILEGPILCDELPTADELFYADHNGITSIKSCCSRYYMSITAAAIAAQMEEFRRNS